MALSSFMRDKDNVIAARRTTGVALGGLGVLGFSFSLPATRLALTAFGPWSVAFGRAAGAGLLAAVYLRAVRAPRPTGTQWRRLAVVTAGIAIGFPVLSSLALTARTAAHGAVVTALLPVGTATFAVLRAGERPGPAFWLASTGGLLAVCGFLVAGGALRGGPAMADVMLLAAVAAAGLGYADGGVLSRELGGARTICWAVVLSLPVTVPAAALSLVLYPPRPAPGGWFGLGYLTAVSMLLGFFAWYAGLARGGIARVGQVQLAQPVLTLAWSALLLGERVAPGTVLAAVAVLACVVLTQRTR